MKPRTWLYQIRRQWHRLEWWQQVTLIAMALAMLVAMLPGCAAVRSYALQGIEAGAQVNDDALAACQVVMCRAASVGSIRRAFNTPAKQAGYEAFCGDFVAQTCEDAQAVNPTQGE